MAKYKVRTTYIDYCIEEEDVEDLVNVRPRYTTSWYDAVDKKIEEIKKSLPQKMVFIIECDDEEDLDDLVCDTITNETCWLINSFDYKFKRIS